MRTAWRRSRRRSARRRGTRRGRTGPLIYGRMVGGSNAHFTGNFWRLRPSRFQRSEQARRRAGHRARRLADHLRGARAVLHESRVGAGRVGRAGTLRSAALASVSDAAAAGEVVGRAAGARRAGARPAPAADADGDQLAALQRPARVPALRLLPVLHVRVPGEVDVDGDDAAAGGGHRAAARSVRRATSRGSRSAATAARPASSISTRRSSCSGSAPGRSCSARTAPRRRACCSTRTSSRFPHGLANSSGVVGKHLMFNTYFGVNAQFEHPLNEYKSVQNTRMVIDFYETDPRRGFYGGGGIDARFGKYPILFALGGLPPGCADVGRRLRARARRAVHADDVLRHARHVAAARGEQRHARSVAEGCLGAAVHARHLQGSSRRLEVRASSCPTARWRSRRRPARARRGREPVGPQTQSVHLLGTCRMGNDPRTSVVDRYHRTHDVRNLFICDGSSMVTSSRGQPTATISALAFRAGEHIAGFARRGEI